MKNTLILAILILGCTKPQQPDTPTAPQASELSGQWRCLICYENNQTWDFDQYASRAWRQVIDCKGRGTSYRYAYWTSQDTLFLFDLDSYEKTAYTVGFYRDGNIANFHNLTDSVQSVQYLIRP